MMKISLVLFALMMVPKAASAYETDVIVNGIRYNVNTNTRTAEVTSSDNSYTGDVVIASSVSFDGVACSVTSIGQYAFRYCSDLTSVSIPSSVKSIGFNAFQYCTKLASVSLPSGVTSIGDNAFDGCSVLTSIDIPNGVKTIGESAFQNCSSLTSINIPNSVTSLGNYAFASSGLTSVIIPTSIKSLGDHVFYNCSGLASVSIPSSVTSIGTEAFSICTKLASVSIPSSVTSIGNGAFRQTGLTSIDIPSSVMSIEEKAFYYCTDLTSVNISEGVKSIGSSAFEFCEGLTSVSIPSSVTSIGYGAFGYCGAITTLEVNIETPLPLDSWTFAFCYNVATLYVPEGSKALYEAAENWSSFGSMIAEMPRCATPTISYANGKVLFACDTEGVEFVPTMSCAPKQSLEGNEMEVGGTYDISVYAKKQGYSNSSVATMTISANKMGDLNGDGEINVSDVTSLVNKILHP